MDASALIYSGVTLVGLILGYAGGIQKGNSDLRVAQETTRQLREGRSEEQRQARIETYTALSNRALGLANAYANGGNTTPWINSELNQIDRCRDAVRASCARSTHQPAADIAPALRSWDYTDAARTRFEAARESYLDAVHADVGPAEEGTDEHN